MLNTLLKFFLHRLPILSRLIGLKVKNDLNALNPKV